MKQWTYQNGHESKRPSKLHFVPEFKRSGGLLLVFDIVIDMIHRLGTQFSSAEYGEPGYVSIM